MGNQSELNQEGENISFGIKWGARRLPHLQSLCILIKSKSCYEDLLLLHSLAQTLPTLYSSRDTSRNMEAFSPFPGESPLPAGRRARAVAWQVPCPQASVCGVWRVRIFHDTVRRAAGTQKWFHRNLPGLASWRLGCVPQRILPLRGEVRLA